MRVDRLNLDEWERALPSDGYEAFHRPEALRVLDDHANGTLHMYGGFKGQRPVALLPVFVRRWPVGATALSPPPGFTVPRLGPVLMPASPKRRKREKINREFTETVLERLGADGPLDLFRVVTSGAYGDPRPYAWNDLRVTPRFTYVLDVGERETDAVLKSFSKSLRREIQSAQDLDVTVTVEGLDAAERIYRETVERYEEGDDRLPVSWGFVRDLLEAMDDRYRTYVLRGPDGEFLSGVTVLYSADTAYFWQGGTRAVHEGVSVNSLLHWRVVEDVAAGDPFDSLRAYDLVGANTERLCRYKAKFGADLVPYYVVETETPAMDAAKRAYEKLSR